MVEVFKRAHLATYRVAEVGPKFKGQLPGRFEGVLRIFQFSVTVSHRNSKIEFFSEEAA